ncbi:hypothetical protein AVEN_103467-1 [Araneus ventricosus]|uniref:Uncharacterized protein n=1 Tax=Araneus ventricosus TaxID=182803 RepID=A0A4Y2MKH6_ARAVE|nr:hypothetical protein AVEN_103467-1 [Araneus ventricosus]
MLQSSGEGRRWDKPRIAEYLLLWRGVSKRLAALCTCCRAPSLFSVSLAPFSWRTGWLSIHLDFSLLSNLHEIESTQKSSRIYSFMSIRYLEHLAPSYVVFWHVGPVPVGENVSPFS